MTRDEAIIMMVESNLQRSVILPSEKAYSYKMRLDAMRRQAGRPSKNNSAPVEQNFDTSKKKQRRKKNRGKLIMDATVAPSDVKYPTDIDLLNRQIYADACERNAIEGRNGNLKRRFGLDLIMSKLDETAKTEAALNILAMNAAQRLRRWLMRIFGFSTMWVVFQ